MTAGQQEVQADAEGQLSGPVPMPVTEEGLDNATEELALEVRCASVDHQPCLRCFSCMQQASELEAG